MHRRQLLLDTQPDVLGLQGKNDPKEKSEETRKIFLISAFYKLSIYHCLQDGLWKGEENNSSEINGDGRFSYTPRHHCNTSQQQNAS